MKLVAVNSFSPQKRSNNKKYTLSVIEKSISTKCINVPGPGLEPGWVAPTVFETVASADSAIRALVSTKLGKRNCSHKFFYYLCAILCRRTALLSRVGLCRTKPLLFWTWILYRRSFCWPTFKALFRSPRL